MRFELSTSSYSYFSSDKGVEKLEKLGFKFEKNQRCLKDVSISGEPEVEINSLEELLDLQKELVAPLIIYENTIEIHDNYRE